MKEKNKLNQSLSAQKPIIAFSEIRIKPTLCFAAHKSARPDVVLPP